MSTATLSRADGRGRPAPWLFGLAVAAVVVIVVSVAATLLVAGDTLGYDFRAYHEAARRVIQGSPLYDPTAQVAGPEGVYLYPPPFVLLALPFALLDVGAASVVWITASLLAFGLGVLVMPVSTGARWATVLLAGLSWPFVYAVKLGQVGPLLFLLFALAWRWLQRPTVVGVAAALGTVVKLQPAVLFGWAIVQRRWTVLVAGFASLAVLALVALPVTGLSAWSDYVALLGRVSDPIATPHNFTPGAIAYQAGIPPDVASIVQLASTVLAVTAVALAASRCSPDASFLVAVVVSQLVSPVLWDHYAMLLLLPVGWLLDRGAIWAVLLPLSAAVPLVGTTPAVLYPVAFWVTIAALLALGWRRNSALRAA